MIGSSLRRWVMTIGIATLLLACGGPPTADLTEADGVKSWAGASAPAVYGTTVAGLNPSLAKDPNCPSVATSGLIQTYTGNCTDTSGVKWIGIATVDGAEGMRASSVTLKGFGSTSQVTCEGKQFPSTATADGTMVTTVIGPGTVSFQVSTKQHYDRPSIFGCAMESGTVTISYAGSYANNGMDPTTWNGSGDVSDSMRGEVHAVTANEVRDNAACDSEALSGTTTLTAEGHTAVITYDGAKSCEKDSTVTWTLDGEPKGVISGIACSAGPAPGREMGAGWAVVPAVALALAWVTRRRRPHVCPRGGTSP
jgi:hypothetical protein